MICVAEAGMNFPGATLKATIAAVGHHGSAIAFQKQRIR